MTKQEARQEMSKVVKSTLSNDMKRRAINSIFKESRKAQWIEVDTNMYRCSNCSHCFTIVPEDNQIQQFKYCPNCGKKMSEILASSEKENK